MKQITANGLRELWQNFYTNKGHAIIGSASLIPENDPTVLFTTAGMHPLVPYLLGAKHPSGTRLANVQKCVRTGDIDEVGDATHCTFFEMLGNWSLGDYFKKEQVAWSFEFLTSPEYLGIPLNKLAFTVFAGDADAPRDEESFKLWEACGVSPERIFYLPKRNNWWGPAGQTGPCGPDTEMFIDTGKQPCCPECSPACDCGKYIEIWNDVFMQYNKTAEGKFEPLSQKNVDTGMGLERTLCILNGQQSVYDTELYAPLLAKLTELSGAEYGKGEEITRAMRIIADHTRTSVFMLGDPRGITPSNVDQGYVLRRLIRRAIRFGRQINLPAGSLPALAGSVIETYKTAYPELTANKDKILAELTAEEERFQRTLATGLREFDKMAASVPAGGVMEGTAVFKLYDTYGFPAEMTAELARERGITADEAGFEAAFKEHQAKSQAGADQRFKGGLADSGEATAKLHTATHLMHAALRKVLGSEVAQKGSNITAERLRFDFSFGRPMTQEEIKETERLVNQAIAADVKVECAETSVEEAKKQGAIGLFESKYGEVVKMYRMGEYSCEICGGPHAERTGELGRFVIQKEQSSSSGVRRIKAVLE